MTDRLSKRYLDADIDEIVKRLHADLKVTLGKTVLITGGMGFIGTYLTRVLERFNEISSGEKCTIYVVDNGVTSVRTSSGRPRKNNLFYLNHDMIKPLKLRSAPDFIIHAAGIASPRYYQQYAIETIDVAVTGTRNVLEIARINRVKKILYFSSSEIYGDPPPQFIPTPETYNGNVSSIGPRSCYDESKRMGETLCVTYYRLYKTPVVIVRPFNVYGPGMKTNDYRVIPNFLNCIMKRQPITVYLKGQQTRTFCYITDAVVGLFLSLLRGHPGEVYNIGNSDEEITMADLAKKIKKVTGTDSKIIIAPYPKDYPTGEPLRRCPDMTKARRDIGFSPEINLQEGVKRTYTWLTNG